MTEIKKASPHPTDLVVHQSTRQLEITFSDASSFKIPFELLRVYSPSAEVQGHGPGQEVLQTGKREVGVVGLEPVGNYGVKPVFSDGHDSGIFTWEYLYHLGSNESRLWNEYEERLHREGVQRDDPMVSAATGGACSTHDH